MMCLAIRNHREMFSCDFLLPQFRLLLVEQGYNISIWCRSIKRKPFPSSRSLNMSSLFRGTAAWRKVRTSLTHTLADQLEVSLPWCWFISLAFKASAMSCSCASFLTNFLFTSTCLADFTWYDMTLSLSAISLWHAMQYSFQLQMHSFSIGNSFALWLGVTDLGSALLLLLVFRFPWGGSSRLILCFLPRVDCWLLMISS